MVCLIDFDFDRFGGLFDLFCGFFGIVCCLNVVLIVLSKFCCWLFVVVVLGGV